MLAASFHMRRGATSSRSTPARRARISSCVQFGQKATWRSKTSSAALAQATLEVGRERVFRRVDGRLGSVRDLLVGAAVEHEVAHGLLDHRAHPLILFVDPLAHQNFPSNLSETSLLSFSCKRILRTYAAFVVMPMVFATSSIGSPWK